MSDAEILRLVIAALGGAAVGLERQWSGHADGPTARFAGIRTFTMLGGIGGLCGWLWTIEAGAPALILLTIAGAIVATAYVRSSRQEIDGTTEVAAVVTIAAGVIAGIGFVELASAIFALEALLLVEKSRLHALVARVDEVGLRSGVRFAVMALVVLPLLPEGPYGPWGGIKPRELWALVLFISGLSFVGYVAQRLAGGSRGYLIAGLLGGMVSSTNVTFTFARTTHADGARDRELALGTVAANAMLYPRVLLVASTLNPALALPLMHYLAPPALVAAALAGLGAFRARQTTTSPDVSIPNPLQLGSALQMALTFQAVLMITHLAASLWGATGTVTSAALLGLTDVDALTLSMARGVAPPFSRELAATAIAVGIFANTAMKLTLALTFGNGTFRRIAGGALGAMLIALGIALAL